ncbi:hypothetical protein FQR65_LT15662 [Abscondita terminalis]|nr:hypothetical protein FQR65_LT15662 [Abscondita terminalis]
MKVQAESSNCKRIETHDSSETPLLSRKKSKKVSVDSARGRTTRRFFCIYCKKLYSKFSLHLTVSHKNEVAVRKFLTLPPKNPERQNIIETIRKRGDFVHNTNPEYNSGQLFVARRSHSDFQRVSKDYLPCPYCTAFFHKESLYHHVTKCIPPNLQSKRSTTILSRKLLADVHWRANEILKSKVFPVLRDDDCASVIKYDLLAILIGNNWCGKYPSQHHRDMIGNKLRSIGCLIFTARSLDSTVTDYASLLTPAKLTCCFTYKPSIYYRLTMTFTLDHDKFILKSYFRNGSKDENGTWVYSIRLCCEEFMEAFPNFKVELDNSESEDDSNALQAANKLQSDVLDNTSKAVLSFQKLNDSQKLDAKLKFLSTLKPLSQPNQQQFYHVRQGPATYPNYVPEYPVQNYESRPTPLHTYNYIAESTSTSNLTGSDISRASRDSSIDPVYDLPDY